MKQWKWKQTNKIFDVVSDSTDGWIKVFDKNIVVLNKTGLSAKAVEIVEDYFLGTLDLSKEIETSYIM